MESTSSATAAATARSRVGISAMATSHRPLRCAVSSVLSPKFGDYFGEQSASLARRADAGISGISLVVHVGLADAGQRLDARAGVLGDDVAHAAAGRGGRCELPVWEPIS